MLLQPIICEWTGETFDPAGPAQLKRANECYIVGERYVMEPHEERSAASHSHFFAALNEAWKNLPEYLAEQYPTAEKLRKHALIRCGYRDERSIVCSSKAEAQRVAAFIAPVDDYAIVIVREAVVTHWTAKSQSKRAMGAKVFQESKTSVLDWVAALIGTTRDELARAGEAA